MHVCRAACKQPDIRAGCRIIAVNGEHLVDATHAGTHVACPCKLKPHAEAVVLIQLAWHDDSRPFSLVVAALFVADDDALAQVVSKAPSPHIAYDVAARRVRQRFAPPHSSAQIIHRRVAPDTVGVLAVLRRHSHTRAADLTAAGTLRVLAHKLRLCDSDRHCGTVRRAAGRASGFYIAVKHRGGRFRRRASRANLAGIPRQNRTF